MHKNKESFWEQLLQPINPNLCVLAGYLNIFYGGWQLLVGYSNYEMVHPLLEHFVSRPAWAAFLVVIGVLIVVAQRYFTAENLARLMSLNGTVWAVMSSLILVGDFHTSVWVLMAMIAIYSLFVSANLKINFGDREKT